MRVVVVVVVFTLTDDGEKDSLWSQDGLQKTLEWSIASQEENKIAVKNTRNNWNKPRVVCVCTCVLLSTARGEQVWSFALTSTISFETDFQNSSDGNPTLDSVSYGRMHAR